MILTLLIAILGLYIVSCLVPCRFKDGKYWKLKFGTLSKTVVNHYCTATPTKVVIFAVRAMSGAYALTAFGWPLIRISYSAEHTELSLQWDSLGLIPLLIYLVLMTIMVCWYLWTQRYDDKANKDAHDRMETSLDLIKTQIEHIPSQVKPVIIENIQNAKKEINLLRLRSGLSLLESLREQAEKYDCNTPETLAKITFWEANCLKYSKMKTAVSKYREAFGMYSSNPPREIIEGYIFALCYEGDTDLAHEITTKFREGLAGSPWLYMPAFLKAGDKLEFINQSGITDSLLKRRVIAESLIFHQLRNEGLDLSVFGITIDENLPLDFPNFSIWLLQLSCSLQNFVSHQQYQFLGEKLATPESELLYRLSERFYQQGAFREIKDILPDFELFYAFTGYLHDRQKHWIHTLKNQLSSCHSKEFAYQSTSFALFNSGEKREAVALLASYDERCSELSWNLIFMEMVIGNYESIPTILSKMIEKKQTEIPIGGCYPIINLVRLIPQKFSELARQFSLHEPEYDSLFQNFIDFYNGEKSRVELLICNEDNAPSQFRSFYVDVYVAAGRIEEALLRVKNLLPHDSIDGATYTYVQLLEESGKKIELLTFLKNLRTKNILNVTFLMKELKLESEVHNHSAAIEICEDLQKLLPHDKNMCYNKLFAYYNAGKIPDDLDELIPRAEQACISDEQIQNLFQILTSYGRENEALDFLYRKIHGSNSQNLRDFYFQIHLSRNEKFSEIIEAEKITVEDGDYIEYTEGKNLPKYSFVRHGGRLSDLIGKQVGYSFQLNQGLHYLTYTLTGIHTKYFGLLREVTDDIMNNQSKAIRCFDFNDIKDNPLEGLQKVVTASRGTDEEQYKKHINEVNIQYESAKLPLFLTRRVSSIADIYNLIFGGAKIFQTPFQKFALRGIEMSDLKDLHMVLDISSLVLLHAICIKFNIEVREKFVIGQRVYDYIKENIEAIKRDSVLHTCDIAAINNLKQFVHKGTIEDYFNLINVLYSLMDWINKHCEIVVVEEYLERSESVDNPVLETVIETMLLAQRENSFLITEDFWMQNIADSTTKINLEYFLRSEYSISAGHISEYFTALNYYGHCLTTDYIISNINARVKGNDPDYKGFLKHIEKNPYVINQVVPIAIKLLGGVVSVPLIASLRDIFYTIFRGLGYELSNYIMGQLSTRPMPQLVKEIILRAYIKYVSNHLVLFANGDMADDNGLII